MSNARFVGESVYPAGTLPAVAGSIAIALVVPAFLTLEKSVRIVVVPTVNETLTLLPARVGAAMMSVPPTFWAR